jgi:hypothetical protein
MRIFLLVLAFAPAGALLALKAYFKSYPPDSSDTAVRGLRRGLKIGTASATALAVAYILLYFRPVHWGNLPYLVCAFVGNIVNLAGLIDCLREFSGESLFAALLLIFTQLLWMWFVFSALMVAN